MGQVKSKHEPRGSALHKGGAAFSAAFLKKETTSTTAAPAVGAAGAGTSSGGNDGPFLMWQVGLLKAVDAFLGQVKAKVDGLVLISFSASKEEKVEVGGLAERLEQSLNAAGIQTKREALVDAETLEKQLSGSKFVIALCSPEYAKIVESAPQVREVLDKFGHTQKNALQTLLCFGGFGDTAFKVVAPHYLVRDFRNVLSVDPKQDALFSEQTFVDILFNLSGSQGLGLLPDILGLNDKANVDAAAIYQQQWQEFEASQQSITVNYRLRLELETSIKLNPLLNIQTSVKAPLIEGKSVADALQSFLQGSAKINLWLAATIADVEMLNLFITQSLATQSDLRVMSIECGQYPGKTASDCVRLSMIKLKINETEVKQNRIVIVFKGYHKFGTYDPVYAQNHLSSWPNLKVIVTCRADFFQTRGYLKCFLNDVSNRKVEDLVVFKIPTFSDKKAQSAASSITYQVQESQTTVKMSAKREAQLSELSDFLIELRRIWIDEGGLKAVMQQNPQIFISYAWEGDKSSLTRQQQHLVRIAHDLSTAGLPTWLDIEQMSGDIDVQMANNIANSQIAIVIGTPRYTERASQDTNVKKEYEAIIAREQRDPNGFTVIPVEFVQSHSNKASLPDSLMKHPNLLDLMGIDDGANYLQCLVDPVIGLVPKLLVNNVKQKERYQAAYLKLQKELERLVGKHLVMNQGKADKQTYDMETRLNGQLKPYGLLTEASPSSERFDLNERLNQFLNHPQVKTFVVLGRAGSGKSLFALSTFVEKLKNWEDYLPLYISLKDYAQYPETCIERALQQQFNLEIQDIDALKNGLGCQQRLLFVLDGYDELGSGIRPNLTQHLSEWPTAKLLITSRPEHFDGANSPNNVLQLTLQGVTQPGAVQVVYVSPFSSDDIEAFVAARGKGENTLTQLQQLPGLMDLLNNPFLLTLVLQSLPQLLKNREGKKNNVTRTEVYQAFTQTWFNQETQGRELKSQDCDRFSRSLAFELFRNKTISLPNSLEQCGTDEMKALWQFFNDPTQSAVQDAAPMRNSGGVSSFIHKSVFEYFVASDLWNAVKNAAKDDKQLVSKWGMRKLREEPEVIDFLSQLYQLSPEEKILFNLIERSRDKRFPVIASTNAATVLNAAQVSFSNRDLSGVRIPEADLSDSNCDGTNFTGADLIGVRMERAWLNHAQLTDANMENVEFGVFPTLKFDYGVSCVKFSPNGKRMAVAAGTDIHLFDAETRKLLKVMEGHTAAINCLSFSPNGGWIVSGSEDQTLILWGSLDEDAPTMKLMEGHSGAIQCLSFSPNGQWIVSGSADKTLILWGSLDQDKLTMKVMEGHTDEITCLSFSSNNQWIASGSIDQTLRLWGSLDTEKPLAMKVMEGHTDRITCLSFSPNGQWIASGGWDYILRLWGSLDKEKPTMKVMEGHTSTLSCLSFSPDGQKIVSGSWDKTIRLWGSLDEEKPTIKAMEGHTDLIQCLSFSSNGQKIVSGGVDKTLRLWSSLDQEKPTMKVIEGHTSSVSCLSFSPNAQWIVSGSEDHTLRLWGSLDEEKPTMKVVEGHAASITCVSFSPNGQWVVSGCMDRTLRLWSSLNQGKPTMKVLEGHGGTIICLSYSPNGQWIVSGSFDGTLQLWGSLDQEKPLAMKVMEGHTGGITCLSFSPNGQWVVSGSNYGECTLILWGSLDQEKPTMKLMKGHTGLINCLSFSPNGQWIVSGGDDMTVRLWGSLNQEKLTVKVIEGHTAQINCISFSPTGQWVVSGSDDETLRLWGSLDQDKPSVKVVEGHTGAIKCLSFSPNGQWVVSGGIDWTLILWGSLNKKKPTMKVMEGHTFWITCLSFSPNGKWIVSGSRDQTLRLWDVETATLLGTVSLVSRASSLCWNDKLLMTGHDEGSLMAWKLSSFLMIDENGKKQKSVEPILHWKRGGSSVLSSSGTTILGAKLSDNNRLILEQSGAKSDIRQITIT